MKRSAPKRRAPIARSPMKRRAKPIPNRNPARRAKLFERNFGDHGAFIRARPCVVPGCKATPIQAAHVRARGMGGCGGDKRDLVPLCSSHHGEQEGRTEWFGAKYSIDLHQIAAGLWRDHYPEGEPGNE